MNLSLPILETKTLCYSDELELKKKILEVIYPKSLCL
nr:MAG TPA: hypothetical protein [Caudoviricetes sp.]